MPHQNIYGVGDWELINCVTGQVVKKGDKLRTFKDEQCEVIDFDPPRHPGSSGHVTLRFDDPDLPVRHYNVNVVNCFYADKS